LARHFAYDYDVSDEVQSNLIVHNGRAVRKHDHIQKHLRPAFNDLSEKGRFLEIACGMGHLVRQFKSEHPQWECYGIDPSCLAATSTNNGSEGVYFIQDYFAPEYFNEQFDVIVAHGFLNRSPTIPELKRIIQLCRPGAIVSLELLVLDNSVFTPYTWDHPFMYLADTFDTYLAQVGLSVVRQTDCVSSVHFLCRYNGKPINKHSITSSPEQVIRTQQMYQQHYNWWKWVLVNTLSCIENKPCRWGLYGAGLYNGILYNHLLTGIFSFVIDEVKAGQEYFGLPVITAKQAAELKNKQVLVCARPAYIPAMIVNLENHFIPYHVLNPQDNDSIEYGPKLRPTAITKETGLRSNGRGVA
jgi:hypothetical protein